MHIATLELQPGARLEYSIAESRNIFFYIVRGKVKVNDSEVEKFHLVEFDQENTDINIEALEDSYILFGHAEPLNEPIAARGPFVMNTDAEILQAIKDYHSGRLG